MRWLILAGLLTGCSGQWYELKPDDRWGFQRTHDFEWHCRGDNAFQFEPRTRACMEAKGYRMVPMR